MNNPILLPFPDRRLSPNARMNHFALHKVKQEARQVGYFAAQESGLRFQDVDLQAFIKINPPDNRARDDDNILASLKSYRDGIFEALGINDKVVRLSTHAMGKVKRRGLVTIWLMPLEDLPEWMKE
jgi:crossover junction endodeoxyribonuclease RusA